MLSAEEIRQANERGQEMQATLPRALSARYDSRSGHIVVELSSKLGIFFSPKDAQGLESASADDLSEIEISPSGFGLHFPRVDADLYVPALIEGKFGSEEWMEERTGRSATSSGRKSAAAAS
jgi:hypothetical protein